MRRLFSASLLPGYLALCLVLGGASAAGFVANAVLQFLAVAIIVGLLWRSELTSSLPNDRLLRVIAMGLIGWLLLQFVPLPPMLWQVLPGRGPVAAGDAILGLGEVWRPLTLQPSKTLISAASILPPIATYLLTLNASEKSRLAAGWAIIGVAIVSSLLGVVQLSQNGGGGAYLYRITNYGATVGFFANANHLATLFLAALLFSSEIGRPKSRSGERTVHWTLLKWTLVGFFALNIFVNGSVAGLGLLVGVLIYVALRQERVRQALGGSRRIWAIGLIAVPLIAAFIWQFSGRLAIFANTSVGTEARLEFAGYTLRMIRDSFPLGFGLGTFQAVYQYYEVPTVPISTYVNHAHNDYLEVIADLGLPALLLMALFAIWFVRRVLWMRTSVKALSHYCPASAMTIIIIAAHSFFDYPLRTAAIAAVFAFACGCIARPIPKEDRRQAVVKRRKSARQA